MNNIVIIGIVAKITIIINFCFIIVLILTIILTNIRLFNLIIFFIPILLIFLVVLVFMFRFTFLSYPNLEIIFPIATHLRIIFQLLTFELSGLKCVRLSFFSFRFSNIMRIYIITHILFTPKIPNLLMLLVMFLDC